MSERDAHLIGTYARFPVTFERGEGARLWDDEGNEYLDFLTGISVSSVGHCHPKVVEAIREQAGRLIHVGNLFYTEPMVRLSRRLAESSLGGRVFFTNSGAEAVEAALKLARRFKQGGEIVVAEGAFHGRTFGALSATPQETKQAPFAPLVPGFVTVPVGRVADAVGERTAAVLLEPIRGESGIHLTEYETLREIRDACDEHGAALIFDELQDDALLAGVRDVGERLRERLAELPGVSAVRGRGLMCAFDLEAGGAPDLVRRALLEQRLVANATGPGTVRLLPPLIIGDAEADEAVARLRALL